MKVPGGRGSVKSSALLSHIGNCAIYFRLTLTSCTLTQYDDSGNRPTTLVPIV